MVGGSSMGSIIAALFSLGFSWEKITKLLTHIHLREYFSIKALWSKGTFLSKQKFRETVLKYTGNINIEDMPIKTVIFATDPFLGKRVFLTKGRLADAILASSAYPVLMSSVKINGKDLVDGDFFPSYSADYFRRAGMKTIFGVGSEFESHLTSLDTNIIDQIRDTYSTLMKNYEYNLDKNDPVDFLVTYKSNDVSRFNFEKALVLVDRVYNKMKRDKKIDKFLSQNHR